MPSSPERGDLPMTFRMTIGLPRPWLGPHVTMALYPLLVRRFRDFVIGLLQIPPRGRAPLLRRMVPVITVHRGLAPPECISLLDTPGHRPMLQKSLRLRKEAKIQSVRQCGFVASGRRPA